MFTTIDKSEMYQQDHEDCETVFHALSDGDVVLLTARNSSECVKARFAVGNTRRDTSESDDYVSGTVEGEQAKLCLPWYPAEPNVGIPKNYSQGPIRFEYDGDTYEVSSIERE